MRQKEDGMRGHAGYEAAEGIHRVREHRINDLGEFGL